MAPAAGRRGWLAGGGLDLWWLLLARHQESPVRSSLLDAQCELHARTPGRGFARFQPEQRARRPATRPVPFQVDAGRARTRREPVHPGYARHANPRQHLGGAHVLVGGRDSGVVAAHHIWRAVAHSWTWLSLHEGLSIPHRI